MAGYEIINDGLQNQNLNEKRMAIIAEEGKCPLCGKVAKAKTLYAPLTRIPSEVKEDVKKNSYAHYKMVYLRLSEKLRYVLHKMQLEKEPNTFIVDKLISRAHSKRMGFADVVFANNQPLFPFLYLLLDDIEECRKWYGTNVPTKNHEELLQYLGESGMLKVSDIADWYYMETYDRLKGWCEPCACANLPAYIRAIDKEWAKESLPMFYAKMRTSKMEEDAMYRNEYCCERCGRLWYGNVYTRGWNLATNGLTSEVIYDMAKYPEISHMEGMCQCGEKGCKGIVQHQVQTRGINSKDPYYLDGEIRIRYSCKKCGSEWWGNFYDHNLDLV